MEPPWRAYNILRKMDYPYEHIIDSMKDPSIAAFWLITLIQIVGGIDFDDDVEQNIWWQYKDFSSEEGLYLCGFFSFTRLLWFVCKWYFLSCVPLWAHHASGGIDSGIGNEFGSHGDIHIGAKKNGDFDHVSQSNFRHVSRGDIRANTKCKLLHWCADGLVVAEGRIASTDPNTKVHHVLLGRSCWKVWVDKVLVENVDLIRPND